MKKRYIKIFTEDDIETSHYIITMKDFEPIINDFFNQLSEQNYHVLKTKYCTSAAGILEAVIIEYESN